MANIATIQDIKYQQMLSVWSARVADRHSSGLTVKEWCHNNNIARATFYKWQREVIKYAGQAHAAQQIEPEFIEVDPINSEETLMCNVPIALVTVGKNSAQFFGNISAEIAAAICKALK